MSAELEALLAEGRGLHAEIRRLDGDLASTARCYGRRHTSPHAHIYLADMVRATAEHDAVAAEARAKSRLIDAARGAR